MKITCRILLLTTMSFSAVAVDVDGTWKATFTDGVEESPKMVSEMTFHFRASGEKLTGKAHMGDWPGDGPLIYGQVKGNRISFTVFGNSPWWAKGSDGKEASGLPKLTFTGTVEGDQMRLTLVWDSVMLYGERPSAGHDYHMLGKKQPD